MGSAQLCLLPIAQPQEDQQTALMDAMLMAEGGQHRGPSSSCMRVCSQQSMRAVPLGCRREFGLSLHHAVPCPWAVLMSAFISDSPLSDRISTLPGTDSAMRIGDMVPHQRCVPEGKRPRDCVDLQICDTRSCCTR